MVNEKYGTLTDQIENADTLVLETGMTRAPPGRVVPTWSSDNHKLAANHANGLFMIGLATFLAWTLGLNQFSKFDIILGQLHQLAYT